MTTDQLSIAPERQAFAQQALTRVVAQFQWQPVWDLPAEAKQLVRSVRDKAEPVDQALAGAALRRYCELWHGACGSAKPFQQRQAFLALHAYLYRTAVAYAQTRYECSHDYAANLAEDVAQATLLLIFQNLGTVKEPGSFLGYVKKMMIHEMIRLLKRTARADSLEEAEAEMSDRGTMPVDEEPAETQTEPTNPIEAAIRRCLRSKDQQQVVIENFLRNKTLQQIADLLGKKNGAIRMLKQRALAGLAQCAELRKFLNEQKPAQAAQAEPMRILWQAITHQPDPAMSCAIAESWLPSLVADEVAGVDVAAKYPDLKRHLDQCPACEQLYGELMALTLDEAAAVQPQPLPIPTPDLSFLPPLPTLPTLARQLVYDVAHHALQQLAPKAVAHLAMLDELFFQRLDLLGGKVPAYRAPAAALSGNEDPASAVLLTLTVAYLTTEQIATTFAVPELRQQLPLASFHQTIQQTATQIAQANGMTAADAQTFGLVYTSEVRRDPQAWLTLVEALAA